MRKVRIKMKILTNLTIRPREIAAIILASFLVFYHTSKVYAFGSGTSISNTIDFLNSFNEGFPITATINTQIVLRVIIVVSLIGVIFKRKEGLLGMWFGITGLIVTQFILSFNASNDMVVSVHSGLSPLRGFFIPSIVTILHHPLRKKLPMAIAN